MVLGIVTLVVTIFMLVKILPTFANMFVGANLPAITLMVVGLSHFVQTQWLIIVIAVIAFVVGFKTFKSTPSGKRIWDSFILKVPVVKGQLKKIYTARFTRTLATLTSIVVFRLWRV